MVEVLVRMHVKKLLCAVSAGIEGSTYGRICSICSLYCCTNWPPR